MTNFIVDINTYAEGAVLLDGFEDCIIGIVEEFGNGRRLLYSKDMILDKLQKEYSTTLSDAEEFYEYNILGLHAGEQNAVFLDLEIRPEIKEEEYIYKLK